MVADLLLDDLGQRGHLLAGLRRLIPLRDTRLEALVTAVHAVTLDDLPAAAVPCLEDEAGLVAVAGGGRTVPLHRVARVHPVLLDEGELTLVGVRVPAEDLAGQLQTVLVGAVVKLRHLGGNVFGLGLLDAGLVGLRHQQRRVSEVPLDAVPRHLAWGSPHAGSERPCRLLATAVAVELGGGQVDTERCVDALLGDRADPLEIGGHQPNPLLGLGGDLLLLGERRRRTGRPRRVGSGGRTGGDRCGSSRVRRSAEPKPCPTAGNQQHERHHRGPYGATTCRVIHGVTPSSLRRNGEGAVAPVWTG